MTKITSQKDYDIINKTLVAVSKQPAGVYLQSSIPDNLVDTDYARYLAVEKFLFDNCLIEKYGASGRVVLTAWGEEFIESRQDGKSKNMLDNFYDGPIVGYVKKKKGKKITHSLNFWSFIATLASIILAVIIYLLQRK